MSHNFNCYEHFSRAMHLAVVSVLFDSIGKEESIKDSYSLGTGETAQQVKAFAAKTENLYYSVLGTQIMEE